MSRYARFGALLDRCDSPIERHFLVGLLFSGLHTFEPLEDRRQPVSAS